jgi:hypothetical protein
VYPLPHGRAGESGKETTGAQPFSAHSRHARPTNGFWHRSIRISRRITAVRTAVETGQVVETVVETGQVVETVVETGHRDGSLPD